MQTALYAACPVRLAEAALGLVAPNHTNFQHRQRPLVTARALGRPGKASSTPPDDASPSPAAPSLIAAAAQPAEAAGTPPAAPAPVRPSFILWHEYEEPLSIIPSIGEAAEAALLAAGMTKAGDLQRYFVETARGDADIMKQFLKSKRIARYTQTIDWLMRECPRETSASATQGPTWYSNTGLLAINGLGKKTMLRLMEQGISSTGQLLEKFHDEAGDHLWVMKMLLKSYGIHQSQAILEWLASVTGESMSDAEDPMRGPLGRVPGVGLKAVLAMHAAGITTVCDLQLEYAANYGSKSEAMKERLENGYGVAQPDVVVAWLDEQDWEDSV